MIKLKDIIKEFVFDRKFGESLPTLEDTTKKHKAVNEGPDYNMFVELNKVSDSIFKIKKKYEKKVDIEAIFRSWMLGLHSRFKKNKIDIQ